MGNSLQYETHHFTDWKAIIWYDFDLRVIKEKGFEDIVIVTKIIAIKLWLNNSKTPYF